MYEAKGQRLKMWPLTLRRQRALAVKAKEANAKTTRTREVVEEIIRDKLKVSFYFSIIKSLEN